MKVFKNCKDTQLRRSSIILFQQKKVFDKFSSSVLEAVLFFDLI